MKTKQPPWWCSSGGSGEPCQRVALACGAVKSASKIRVRCDYKRPEVDIMWGIKRIHHDSFSDHILSTPGLLYLCNLCVCMGSWEENMFLCMLHPQVEELESSSAFNALLLDVKANLRSMVYHKSAME